MKLGFSAISVAALVACGGGGSGSATHRTSGTAHADVVQKVAGCQSADSPETGLQGQVSAALRAGGYRGFNCNLSLVGQLQGEGGNWSSATFTDGAGRRCLYHSTATPGVAPNRQNPGVPVIDITNPSAPMRTTSLTTSAMMDPWESLRVNARRQLLIADNGSNAGGDSTIDVYDLSGDCRSPQLMSSIQIDTGGGMLPTSMQGHEGNVSPDGLTYYVGDYMNKRYNAIDITNPTRPRLLASWSLSELGGLGISVHGLSVSEDGNRMYGTVQGKPDPAKLGDDNVPAENGFIVFDTSEVQQRKPGAQIKEISRVLFKDGSSAQHTIPIKIAGKSYIVMVDEGGSAGVTSAEKVKAACDAGMAPYPMARLFDASDEKNPKVVSKLGLETHDPKNCESVSPDIAGLSIFTYGSHYCSVDNRENATALACSYFNSGIRVFDIRDPADVREIAYYNPPPTQTPPAGSSHVAFGQWKSGGPDWCASRLDFDYASKQLTTMCQDNGALILQFAPGTWPFPQSVASRNQS